MSKQSNKPTHILFHIKRTNQTDEDTGYNKGLWTRIGAGFPCKDGRINIVQDYVPNCAGTLQLVPAESLDKEAQN